jgi:hypothetical protein
MSTFYEREFTRNKACNIVAEPGERWTERTAFAVAPIGFIADRLLERMRQDRGERGGPAQDRRVSHDFQSTYAAT